MMPWFVWNGKNSLADFGLWVSKFPKHVRPEERHEEIEVPGRAGSLLMLEGEDVYSSYNDEMVITARNSLPIDRICDWLRGSGDLILSTEPGKARAARIVGEVAFERVGNWLQQATIPFLFQPFRKSIHPEKDRVTITSTPDYVNNCGDVVSYPIVRITGSGNNTITIAGNAMTFTDLSDTIVVDCGAQMITKGNNVWDKPVTGNFWVLPTGRCNVVQTGNATIVIDPELRWF